MKWFSFLTRCALLVPLLTVAVQADVGTMLDCLKGCESTRARLDKCIEGAQGGFDCNCRTVLLESETQSCISKSCKPKDLFDALNTIANICNEPVRSKQVSYRTTLIVFFTLAVIAIISRFVTHFTVGRTSMLDNINLGLAFLLNIVLFVCCIRMSYLGLGKDMWKVESETITSTLLYFWLSEWMYFATIGLVKTGFLIFYLQIFPARPFRRITWACIILNLAATLACTLAGVFVCLPISFVWNQWDGEHQGHCVSNNNLAFAHAGIGIVMDFVTLALPITQIWNLQLSTKKKIGVLLMFSVGSFVTVVSILRLRSLIHFAKTQNMTWDYLEASLWSVIEAEVGIVCLCMPAIRLGLARLFPKMLGSSLHSDSKQTGPNNSHGNTLGTNWSQHAIGVTTSVRVTHAKRPQTHDESSFIQLVEVDADGKSAKSNRSDE